MMPTTPTTSTTATAEILFTRTTSLVGELLLVGERRGRGIALCGVYFAKAAHADGALPPNAREDAQPFAKVIGQLQDYFAGERRSFDLPLAPVGTDFQQKVWRALTAIPYGETTTYAAIAKKIGKPRAVRAVGAANGRNPLSIVVPCHRVIGNDGTLTGYAGGLPNKKRLLDLESRS